MFVGVYTFWELKSNNVVLFVVALIYVVVSSLSHATRKRDDNILVYIVFALLVLVQYSNA